MADETQDGNRATMSDAASCPACDKAFPAHYDERKKTAHTNHCIDGTARPFTPPKAAPTPPPPMPKAPRPAPHADPVPASPPPVSTAVPSTPEVALLEKFGPALFALAECIAVTIERPLHVRDGSGGEVACINPSLFLCLSAIADNAALRMWERSGMSGRPPFGVHVHAVKWDVKATHPKLQVSDDGHTVRVGPGEAPSWWMSRGTEGWTTGQHVWSVVDSSKSFRMVGLCDAQLEPWRNTEHIGANDSLETAQRQSMGSGLVLNVGRECYKYGTPGHHQEQTGVGDWTDDDGAKVTATVKGHGSTFTFWADLDVGTLRVFCNGVECAPWKSRLDLSAADGGRRAYYPTAVLGMSNKSPAAGGPAYGPGWRSVTPGGDAPTWEQPKMGEARRPPV